MIILIVVTLVSLVVADLDSLIQKNTLLYLKRTQEIINKIHDDNLAEIGELHAAYHQLKVGDINERAIALHDVPEFWKTVLTAHSETEHIFTELDFSILEYVTDVDVEYLHPKVFDGNVRLWIKLKHNPYIETTSLWRVWSPTDDYEDANLNGPLKWKHPAGEGRSTPDSIFFAFFGGGADHTQSTLIAHAIREVWANPMEVFEHAHEPQNVHADLQGAEEEL
eukprot:PhF_6_TR19263/c0_g1_i1/m.28315/K11290/SET, TAF1, I2PP2A; template-activating factor I